MRVWELYFYWEDGAYQNKLFQENNPPSINRIGELLEEWGLHPNEVLKVTEKFLRGGNSYDLDFYAVGLREVNVE